ncbi:MAG: N-acetylmuramoyl-L-alanine amidase [Dethiobacteria bacterium]
MGSFSKKGKQEGSVWGSFTNLGEQKGAVWGGAAGRGNQGCINSAVVLIVVVALLGVLLFPAFGGRAAAAGFPDLPEGHWAAADVLAAAAAGYIKGYPDGTFQPGREITRAEFATVINSYFGFQTPENSASFKDVAGKDWYFPEISKATAAGYFQGYPGDVFRPGAPITRQEVAGVLGKILAIGETAGPKFTAAGGGLSFADAGRIGTWAQPAVAGLVSRGLFAGYPDGNFRPLQAVTRAEAAVLITKAGSFLQDKVKNASAYLKVDGDIVNIRSGPGQSFGVLGKVQEQDVLKTESFCNEWYKVGYSGQAGWIAGWLVQGQASPPPKPAEPGVPAKPHNPENPGNPGKPNVSDYPDEAGDPGTLQIEILPGEAALKVCLIAGSETDYSFEEREDSHRLVITVSAVDSLKSARSLHVGQAGLEEIITRLAGEEAVVEFQFADFPVAPAYSIKERAPGRLEVVVPHQLLALDIEETDELVTVHLQATAPFSCEAFRLRNPQRIVMDFPNLQLIPALVDWEKGFAIPFLQSLRLGQFSPDVVRLVADLDAAVSYEIIPAAGNSALTIRLQKATVRGKRVCLDPGHGGSDPGAVGPTGLREKDVNLAIALQTAALLRAAGVEVMLTREGDYYVDLPTRAIMANDRRSEIFVSIHSNAALNNPVANGTSTYTYDGWQKEERAYLSALLQEELVSALGLRNIGIFRENFAVLRNTQMPAALVEVAFVSNPAEEQRLADRDFQRRAAEALAQAITRYFTE